MTRCELQDPATVELFFYGELTQPERVAVERHLARCVDCRRILEELAVIRSVLGAQPDVSSPPCGDWSGFMARLDRAVGADAAGLSGAGRARTVQRGPRALAAILAAAALLALVTVSVSLVLPPRGTSPQQPAAAAEPAAGAPMPVGLEPTGSDAALTQVSEGHFERSKLVVLGLATRDAEHSTAEDWSYERSLASSLLNDTRLYRQAAEERGMKTLAGVMRDLELVLLQTAMSETPDAESLGQLQRLIRRRDLITKMDVVATTGLVP